MHLKSGEGRERERERETAAAKAGVQDPRGGGGEKKIGTRTGLPYLFGRGGKAVADA